MKLIRILYFNLVFNFATDTWRSTGSYGVTGGARAARARATSRVMYCVLKMCEVELFSLKPIITTQPFFFGYGHDFAVQHCLAQYSLCNIPLNSSSKTAFSVQAVPVQQFPVQYSLSLYNLSVQIVHWNLFLYNIPRTTLSYIVFLYNLFLCNVFMYKVSCTTFSCTTLCCIVLSIHHFPV